MTKYRIGIKIQLEEPPREDQVRYVQCGFGGKSRIFTGHIADYMGSGERKEFYFHAGKLVVECGLRGQHWSLEIQPIEEQFPDLLEEIREKEKQYFYYYKEKYLATLLLSSNYDKLRAFHNLPHRIFIDGPVLAPMTVGNTGFADCPNYPEGFPEWSKKQFGFKN